MTETQEKSSLFKTSTLYYLSVLCLLSGILMLSYGMRNRGWDFGQIALFFLVQVYEIILILGSYLLLKSKDYRNAALLALLEVFFLLDITIRLESVAGIYNGPGGFALSTLWLIAVASKIITLFRMFKISWSYKHLAIPVIAAAVLAYLPYSFYSLTDRLTRLGLFHFTCWLPVIFITLYHLLNLKDLTCNHELIQSENDKKQKYLSSTWAFLVVVYILHIFDWSYIFEFQVAVYIPVGIAMSSILVRDKKNDGGFIMIVLMIYVTFLIAVGSSIPHKVDAVNYMIVNMLIITVAMSLLTILKAKEMGLRYFYSLPIFYIYAGVLFTLLFSMKQHDPSLKPFLFVLHFTTFLVLSISNRYYYKINYLYGWAAAYLIASIFFIDMQSGIGKWFMSFTKSIREAGTFSLGIAFIIVAFVLLIAGIYFNYKKKKGAISN